ncbi:hypothetical protein HBH56_218610 [Parastagonospora nodorum]|nr:hypothetical protein HBH56_218610 [Parastagonospora nodorum]KAH3922724.1 hypothetical protein HBH54_220470 [Parastagonospora nodorum]KAH4082241.1 hypothetical protein HBH46_222060 [Parastagonospora nodorum]KAH4338115.1 hypothetical protein HBH98_215060 [Parastagonospora nodorum]KAH5090904.1 hypothetical protein HBH72_210510 [Parastagonospora nodorum]
MARAVIKSTLGLAQPRVLRFAFSIDVQAFSTPDWLLRLAVDSGRAHVSAYTFQPTSNPLVSDLGAIMYHAMFSKSPSRLPASNCAPESDNELFVMLSLKIHQSREGLAKPPRVSSSFWLDSAYHMLRLTTHALKPQISTHTHGRSDPRHTKEPIHSGSLSGANSFSCKVSNLGNIMSLPSASEVTSLLGNWQMQEGCHILEHVDLLDPHVGSLLILTDCSCFSFVFLDAVVAHSGRIISVVEWNQDYSGTLSAQICLLSRNQCIGLFKAPVKHLRGHGRRSQRVMHPVDSISSRQSSCGPLEVISNRCVDSIPCDIALPNFRLNC